MPGLVVPGSVVPGSVAPGSVAPGSVALPIFVFLLNVINAFSIVLSRIGKFLIEVLVLTILIFPFSI